MATCADVEDVIPVIGRPVQLVRVPDAGVPSAGAVNVGLVKVLFVKVSVDDVVTIFTPSMVTTPAEALANVVSVAWPNSTLPTPNAVLVEAVKPLMGNALHDDKVPLLGVPNTGAVNVGEVNVLLVKVSVPAKLTKSPSVSEVLYSAIVPFFKLALVIFRDKGVPAGSSTIYKTSSSLAEVSAVRSCTSVSTISCHFLSIYYFHHLIVYNYFHLIVIM